MGHKYCYKLKTIYLHTESLLLILLQKTFGQFVLQNMNILARKGEQESASRIDPRE